MWRERGSRLNRAAVSSALAVCLALSLTSPASADDPADKKRKVDEKITATQDSLHDTSRDLAQAYTALRSTRAKLPAARKRSVAAAAAETRAQSTYDDAAAALTVAKADEAKARKDIRSTSTKITEARQSVGAFAGDVYQQQGLGDLTVALGSESPAEAVDRMVMADSAGGAQSESLSTLSTSRADLVAQENRLKALKKKTQKARDAASTALSAATKASNDADAAQTSLEDLESDQTSQAATLRTERTKEKKRLTGLQGESDRLGDILAERARKARIREAKIKAARDAQAQREREARARTTSGDTTSDPNPAPPPSSGVLSAPINAPVTSEFGLRFHPVLHYWRLHAGRDYGGACGAPVYAAAEGEIISAAVAGGYGNRIVVDHGVHRGVSLATTYNHLERFARTSGKVSRGTLIGYEGTTGMSTGCHLHFETWENGTPADPRGWL